MRHTDRVFPLVGRKADRFKGKLSGWKKRKKSRQTRWTLCKFVGDLQQSLPESLRVRWKPQTQSLRLKIRLIGSVFVSYLVILRWWPTRQTREQHTLKVLNRAKESTEMAWFYKRCQKEGEPIHNLGTKLRGLPRWCYSKELACQCRRHGFSPWVRKIPWRREWQPNPIFLPREFHGQRSLSQRVRQGERLTLSPNWEWIAKALNLKTMEFKPGADFLC